MPGRVFFPFSPFSSQPQWPFMVVAMQNKLSLSTWWVAFISCDWYIPDQDCHCMLDFRIVTIFLNISVLLHVVVTENMHHWIRDLKWLTLRSWPYPRWKRHCHLTLNETKVLMRLTGSIQSPDGRGAGPPGGTWHGQEVLTLRLIGLGNLSTCWCPTVPHGMWTNPLWAQLTLESFNGYFFRWQFEFQWVGEPNCGRCSTIPNLSGPSTSELLPIT